MPISRRTALLAALLALAALLTPAASPAARHPQRRLYVAVPGIRDYLEWGGAGLLVYDIDHGHRFLKRLPLFPPGPGKVEAIKGVCASARTGRLYVSTPTRMACLDLVTERLLWNRAYPGGCDRMSMTPDGATLYVPSFEGPHWNVVDGATGDVVTQIERNSGSHNTVCGPDGTRAYLAGLKSPLLTVADTRANRVLRTVGPFSNVVRPFTVNGRESLSFVNVNGRLGFEVGDLNTGKVLHQVDVAGYGTGPTKRHGCPSHGVALTPDERELWLADSFNSRIHIFDATRMPPRQKESLPLGDQPGWITFGIDGRYVYPSSGEVIETRSRRVVALLKDEDGKPVQSEKLLEIDFDGDRPVRSGDQFGIGQRR
jgi:hypothetical protein